MFTQLTISSAVLSALIDVSSAHPQHAAGKPFGYAAGTTGGGRAAAAIPSSNAQLRTWLADSTARTIVLDRMFDFTLDEGERTDNACMPWTCSPNPQLAINGAGGWCDREYPNSERTTVTYNASGITPLIVGSNKSLIGQGKNAGLRGKGIQLVNSTNVIVQNIKIVDINPHFVWGGDALQIDGGSKIWIDHNHFQNIARQMVVTHIYPVNGTTFSNNMFNGESQWSAVCNGQHYWTAFLTGPGDQITFAQNYLYKTSGRGPKVGGTTGYTQNIHIYNNYFASVQGHALDAGVGSTVLMEGNYFNNVTLPINPGGSGQAFAPTTSEQGAQCASSLARACVTNILTASGSLSGAANVNAVKGFTDATARPTVPMAARKVPAYVKANAGVGIVN